MSEVPTIVISSPFSQCGKTTLSLNLAAALWNEGYKVSLFAPQNETIEQFIKQRRKLCENKKLNLPMPILVDGLHSTESTEKEVLIAVIPAENMLSYDHVFNEAHTLITVIPSVQNAFWNAADDYLNLIWNAKKHIAARGVKNANWILVPYIEKPSGEDKNKLNEAARRYGFRVADVLPYRDAYNHIKEGYCAADMKQYNSAFHMTFADVYARREILCLTDFFWKLKA